MRLARLWLGILVACLVLSGGYLYLFPLDEIEAILRAAGSVDTFVHWSTGSRLPGDRDFVRFHVATPLTSARSERFRHKLAAIGWHEVPARGISVRVLLLVPLEATDASGRNVGIYQGGGIHYVRPATPGEP